MILGLDCSTSVVGWSILDTSGHLVDYGYVDMTRLKSASLEHKMDYFCDSFSRVLLKYSNKISAFAIEEAVLGFTKGRSSANTITKLISFNFAVRYWVYKTISVNPVLVNSSRARKLAGLQFEKNTNSADKKKVVANFVENKFSIKLPKTKNGTYKYYSFDIADSIIVSSFVQKELNQCQTQKDKEQKS